METDQGFRLFKNILSEEDVEFGRSAFLSDHRMNYSKMTVFVNNCLAKLNGDYVCVKYRASNNTNSSDAGLLHRDIMNYGKSVPPVFTVLSYLDTASLRIIPGSYKLPSMTLVQSIKYRMGTKKITINPGDLFMFHSSSIHSGLFDSDTTRDRRLVQIFEVYPTRELLDYYNKNYTLHIQCDGKKCINSSGTGKLANAVSRVPGLKFINELLYFNAALGYGKNPVLDQGFTIVSSEATAQRVIPGGQVVQGDNLYYMFEKTNNVENDSRWDYIRSEVFLRTYIIIMLVFLICLNISYRVVWKKL